MKNKCLICAINIQSDSTIICDKCTEYLEKIKNNKKIEYWKKLGFQKNFNKMTFEEQIKKCDEMEKKYNWMAQKKLIKKSITL